MSTMPLSLYPDPVLREKAQPVTKFDDALFKLAQDMVETAIENIGIGLAAPQVGILSRLFVVTYKDPFAVINPEIISGSGSDVMEEGCLSLPEVILPVERFTKIRVKFQTVTGEKVEATFKGLVARIIQHETDHLNGILIYDRETDLPLSDDEDDID
jgi:peptide deformylase